MISRRSFIKNICAIFIGINLPILAFNLKNEPKIEMKNIVCKARKLKATWTLELQNELADIYRLP